VQFRLPRIGASNQAFLTAARGMLDKATAQKDLLVSLGMSASLLDDLAAALGQFEKTLEATRAGRARSCRRERRSPVRRYRRSPSRCDCSTAWCAIGFGDNAELMGAWVSARNVLGPFRSRSEPDAGEGETPAEAGPDAVKPAA